jgi:pimeloyl-ACP methyl ester carboxylesterase
MSAVLAQVHEVVRDLDLDPALLACVQRSLAGPHLPPQLVRVADTIASQRAVTRTSVLGYSQGGHVAWLLDATGPGAAALVVETGRFDVVLPVSAPSRRATSRHRPRAPRRSRRCTVRMTARSRRPLAR